MTGQTSQLNDVRADDVVVGVDGSSSSTAALRWAAHQARITGGRLLAVMAWEVPVFYGWAPAYPYEDLPATAGKVLGETVREALGVGAPDVPVLESVVAGHPAQVLIEASGRAALLVVGSHGHGTFTGGLLGSVSQRCVHHAHCPVVVVRDKD
ncbi:universal stress protein [Actinoplanes sp. L3-i22]|uniref:universal stress protein n=1 Tax=Actinoplanes sp. L3-i22 TaxID=2836373 RepID=UPI001C75399F|nr:universal stress protein [Actinoplanes sp. L3-i22]BCY09468.1 universal stress protein [Actinoplanes sp. L3-i22]